MNGKKLWCIITFGVILLVCGMAAGCRSQPDIAGSSVFQSVENLGRLEEQNRQFAAITDDLVRGIKSIEDRIDNAQNGIESAQTDARGAEQDIDTAIRLFIEYKRRVDQFIADYRKLQDQIKNSY
jgi:peptidoglycan hydrolase CwlO-like protein